MPLNEKTVFDLQITATAECDTIEDACSAAYVFIINDGGTERTLVDTVIMPQTNGKFKAKIFFKNN